MRKILALLFCLSASPAFAGLNYVAPISYLTNLGTGVSATGGATTTITSVALTPGTWLLAANWASGTTAANTWVNGCIATAANATTGCTLGDTQIYSAYDGSGGAGGGAVGGIVVTVAANTTYYWNVSPRAVTLTVTGRITAIRLY